MRLITDLLSPTPGYTVRERFSSPDVQIDSEVYTCKHGKHYEVMVTNKECGHRTIVAHSHSYSEHWRQMYDASERLVIQPMKEI